MQNKVVKEASKDLHDRYVTTPINKANGNVACNCKKFHAFTFLENIVFSKSNFEKAVKYLL